MSPALPFDVSTLSSISSIIFISLSLSGDNALVIGMAAYGLPARQRRVALIGAIAGAIAFRVFFAGLFAVLLYRTDLPGIRLVGGVLLAGIAWKLMVDPPEMDDTEDRDTDRLWEALAIILIADVSMSIDNMLAIASASNGHLWLIVTGLLVSIPLLFTGATVVSRVLERVPQIVWLAGALISWIAGELIAEEPLLNGYLEVAHAPDIVAGITVLGVIGSALFREHLSDG